MFSIYLCGNKHHLESEDSRGWILTGTGNKLRYVDIIKIYEQLGASLCRSLPGFHSITGCDYNPDFLRKVNEGHSIYIEKIKNINKYLLNSAT